VIDRSAVWRQAGAGGGRVGVALAPAGRLRTQCCAAAAAAPFTLSRQRRGVAGAVSTGRPGECGANATAEVLDAIALRVFHHTSYWRRWTVQ